MSCEYCAGVTPPAAAASTTKVRTLLYPLAVRVVAVAVAASLGWAQEPVQPMPSFTGTLKRMDNKTIVLELDDFRVLEFRRTGKTKFYKKGVEVKPAVFEPGDLISVEILESLEGHLDAMKVHWETAPGEAPPGRDAARSGH
jgi:hypothetical protein